MMKVEIEIDETTYGLLCRPDEVQPLFEALDELYGVIWCESSYDPTNEHTKQLCARMLPFIRSVNTILHFKK